MCDDDEDNNTKEADDAASGTGRREDEGKEGGGAYGGWNVIVSQTDHDAMTVKDRNRMATDLAIPFSLTSKHCQLLMERDAYVHNVQVHFKYVPSRFSLDTLDR